MKIRKSYRMPKDIHGVSAISLNLFDREDIQYLAKHGVFINYDIITLENTYEHEIVFEFDLPEKHVTFYNIKYGTR